MYNSLKRHGWWSTKLNGTNLEGLLDISKKLGKPVCGRKKGTLIETLRPVSADYANENSLSNIFELSAFPFHCDTAHWVTPCRYVVLGCKDPGSCRRKTILTDWKKIEFESSEVDLLKRAVFLIKNGRNSFYSTILDQHDGFFRFDLGCMTSIDEESKFAVNLIQKKLSEAETLEFSWEKDIVLVIDNWRILHGRGQPDVESERQTTRELHRVLVV